MKSGAFAVCTQRVVYVAILACLVYGGFISRAHAQTVPTITWANPAQIVYGTSLSSDQLDASADTAGTFVYTPDFGTVLHAGTNQTLHVVFTPDDPDTFASASADVTIDVQKRLLNPTATGINKVYDGTADATSVITSDKLSADDVSVSYAQQLFDDPNVGAGKVISLAGPSISGNSAGDYDLIASRISATADITPATSTIFVASTTQDYDGTPKSVIITTDPAGLATSIMYDGSTTPPTDAGDHAVIITITDPNYATSTTATLSIIAPAPVAPPVVSSGGGGGGGGGGGNGPLSGFAFGTSTIGTSPISGRVLAASTTTVPVSCPPLLTTYLRRGAKNDARQVTKLQQFLNTEMQSTLPLTGYFGMLTESIVKKFQTKYADHVLAPAGLSAPTGFVFRLTESWINSLNCTRRS